MKEATGELNMTVVTIVIIAAVLALAATVVVPAISAGVRNQTCQTMMGDSSGVASSAKAVKSDNKWYCCPNASYNATICVELTE